MIPPPPSSVETSRAAAARLADAVRRTAPEGVVAVWLFGSVARGDAGPLSDVDVAVLFGPGVSADERVALAARCSSLWAPAVAGDIQAVVLNDAPPALLHQILREGILLLGEDDRRRVAFETRAMLEYLDFHPVLSRYDEALLARARKGRLGT